MGQVRLEESFVEVAEFCNQTQVQPDYMRVGVLVIDLRVQVPNDKEIKTLLWCRDLVS